MGELIEGGGYEVDGVKFELFAPTITMQALAIAKDQEAKEQAPQLAWSELAELTHGKQVELFGFCTCEDGPKVWDDCTQDGKL
jgi:hypothetical protein